MKHQYFGDVSDYKKYSVLRAITDSGGLRMVVAWMLTPEDKRNDGNVNKYLQNPAKWRKYETDIFDFLYESVVTNQTKDLGLVEKRNIVPEVTYFWDVLTDEITNRKLYFDKLKQKSEGFDLVFVDPDNGIATSSVTKGRKNSSKYVFMDEISDLWDQNHSLLIYQHFPRVNRTEYIKRKVGEIKDFLRNEEAYVIRTTYMVYFLIPKKRHAKNFKDLKQKIEDRWGKEIIVDYF